MRRALGLPHTRLGRALASDENTALNFPHKFAPLPLSRPSSAAVKARLI